MNIILPAPEQALACLRAVTSVAVADGPLHDLESRLLHGLAHLVGCDPDQPLPVPLAPADLAASVTDPSLRRHVVQLCIFAAMIDGEVSDAERTLIHAYAQALDVDRGLLTAMEHFHNHHLGLMRMDIVRHSFIGMKLKDTWRHRGLHGIYETVRAALGKSDPRLAARYQALEGFPADTLGAAYYAFIRRSGFSLPGEPGGPPEILVAHDCTHVLGGYGTTVAEETRVGSFQAGYLQQHAFWGLLFVLCQFHLGVQVTPITPAVKDQVQPEEMLRHFMRGRQVTVNLFEDWDPWQVFHRPLAELRAAYNVLPRASFEVPVAG